MVDEAIREPHQSLELPRQIIKHVAVVPLKDRLGRTYALCVAACATCAEKTHTNKTGTKTDKSRFLIKVTPFAFTRMNFPPY